MTNAATPPSESLSPQAQVQSLLRENEQLRQELKFLRQKLEWLIKRYFGGGKSEHLDPHQLELLLAGLATAAQPLPPTAEPLPDRPPKPTQNKPVRQPLPAHLEVQEVLLEPEEIKQDPAAWKKIGEERTEELDWTPARFIKRVYVRPKYVRVESQPVAQPSDLVDEVWAEMQGQEKKAVVIARLPSRLIEKGFPGAGLLTQVVLSKYADHLPLYRQEKIYRERYGVRISRQTLCEWVEQVATWLKPVYEAIRKDLLAGGYLQADETPVDYLDWDLPGKARQGYLWAYSRPGADIIFDWQTTRSHTAPLQMLAGFNGQLQTDGYEAYETLNKVRARENQPLLSLLGCWAHARRKFFEALEEDRRAAWFVRQIAQLYGVEAELRKSRAGPALRQARRAAEAKPILARIRKAIDVVRPKVLPKNRLGQALGYAHEQWLKLLRYVEDGRLEIDNNLIENAIRPTAIGKKNFLFIGHPSAGWRSAVIYSILGSCRRRGINPYEYLRDILQRLPDMKMSQIVEITPSAWAKARNQRIKPGAQGHPQR